ncbi:MAG: aminoglycoside phosphotransferase family protein [Deltaproteobacteria bacterium]|nr:aminoglycoside phosphotransferase family protein [Deltaproteobacteria bacterium]
MKVSYLGDLSRQDPLFGYLQADITPQLGIQLPEAAYRVYKFSAIQDVFLYEETHCYLRLVGKFHKAHHGRTTEQSRAVAETEYQNLCYLRSLGLDRPPHYVVRPFGFNPLLDNVLILEYLPGELLSDLINDAIHRGKRQRLFRKLSGLAYFLAFLHNRTARTEGVDFQVDEAYLERILHSIQHKRGVSPARLAVFSRLGDNWRAREEMWQDCEVLLHGDATPSNFIFGPEGQVMLIDVERMKRGDRVFDLGRLAGELKHFFFRATADPQASEPFIGHFLWEYCRHFPDQSRAFAAITRRIPFHLGLTLLRIARNSWIDDAYRWSLLGLAEEIMR